MSDIVKTIFIAASVDHVWRYLTEPKLLASWLMDNDIAPQEGRAFRFTYDATNKEEYDGVISCKVKQVKAPELIVFSWTDQAMDGVETEVRIELEKVGALTRLKLVHSGWDKVPRRDFFTAEHDKGWDEHLVVLREKAAVD